MHQRKAKHNDDELVDRIDTLLRRRVGSRVLLIEIAAAFARRVDDIDEQVDRRLQSIEERLNALVGPKPAARDVPGELRSQDRH